MEDTRDMDTVLSELCFHNISGDLALEIPNTSGLSSHLVYLTGNPKDRAMKRRALEREMPHGFLRRGYDSLIAGLHAAARRWRFG
jgi:hypothetical protein